MSRREGVDFALTGEGAVLSEPDLGEAGGEFRAEGWSVDLTPSCKPKEAINSTKEGRAAIWVGRKERGRWSWGLERTTLEVGSAGR